MSKKIFKYLLYFIIITSLFGCVSSVGSLVTNYLESDIEYYDYDGIKIKYSDTGSGKPIVFIHGFGANSFTWRYLLKYFSLEYRVISIDLMGFGDSEKPINSGYLVSDQATIVSDFIKDKNLNDVTLVGNSLGGTISLFTYFKTKDKVTNLILLNPAVYTTKKIPAYISLLQIPLLNRLALKIGPKNFLANFALKTIFYDDSLITRQMINNYGHNMESKGTQNALIKSVKEDAFTEVDNMVKNYGDVDIPVLIIWGEEDHIINVKDGIKLQKNIPKSKLVILEDCGHLPQEELPNQTISVIDDFFDEI